MSGVFGDAFFTEQHLPPSILQQLKDKDQKPSIYISYVCVTQKINNGRVISRTRQLISFNKTGEVHMSEKREIGRHSVKYIKDIDKTGRERNTKELSGVEQTELDEFSEAWAKRCVTLPEENSNFTLDDIKEPRKRPRRLEENRSAAIFQLKKPDTPRRDKQSKKPKPKPKMRAVSPAPASRVVAPGKQKHADPGMTIAEHGDELECLRLVNEYRLKNGKPKLMWNDKLRDISLPHTIAMRKRDVPVDHTNFKQRCEQMPGVSMGENVAMVQGAKNPVQQMMIGWIKSLHHRENILGNFNSFGVTFVYGADNRWYGTQLFAYIPSGKMADAISISRKDQKELLSLINKARKQSGLKELEIMPEAQRVLTKYARRVCCGKVRVGDEPVENRTNEIFSGQTYNYLEFSGGVSILGSDYVSVLATNWLSRKDVALLGEEDTHVGFGVAYDERGTYFYSVAVIKIKM